MTPLQLVTLITALTLAKAQPPGNGPSGQTVSGQTWSPQCTVSSGSCSGTGSSSYISRSLTYNASNGVFTGTIVTNQCSNNKWGRYGGVDYSSQIGHSATCVQQTFPAPAYANTPRAAPLRGPVAFSISGGVNIYGPLEAGFTSGQACSINAGTCDAGIDVYACGLKLEQECGTNLKKYMMMDDCGGHASPYHFHFDLSCDYDKSVNGHSALIGIALDGRGIYGLYETTGSPPTDLDACSGHYGPVPAYTIGGVTYPAASNVYHYHTQSTAPFTLGCFGPVKSLTECKALYNTCGTGYTTFATTKGTYTNYDTDCPCYKNGTETYNQITTGTTTTKSASTKLSIPISFLLIAVLLLC